MGLFDLFSRKKKEAVPKNWLENGYLIVENLLEATKRKDVRSLKKIAKSDECDYFVQEALQATQIIADKVDSGEKEYEKMLAIFEKKLHLGIFDLGASEESTSGYFEHGTLAKLYIEGKKIQDWEKLEEELKLVKNC